MADVIGVRCMAVHGYNEPWRFPGHPLVCMCWEGCCSWKCYCKGINRVAIFTTRKQVAGRRRLFWVNGINKQQRWRLGYSITDYQGDAAWNKCDSNPLHFQMKSKIKMNVVFFQYYTKPLKYLLKADPLFPLLGINHRNSQITTKKVYLLCLLQRDVKTAEKSGDSQKSTTGEWEITGIFFSH